MLLYCPPLLSLFFFFNDTATTEIYTLSLHDALPISIGRQRRAQQPPGDPPRTPAIEMPVHEAFKAPLERTDQRLRSEEHTSELQSRLHLVCRLLLEKKKKKIRSTTYYTKQ